MFYAYNLASAILKEALLYYNSVTYGYILCFYLSNVSDTERSIHV